MIFREVNVKRGLLIVSGLITCPCHLPLVLPLLGAALAGTSVGTFIQNHLWGIGIAATLYFIFVVLYALKKWSRNTQFDMISGDEGQ